MMMFQGLRGGIGFFRMADVVLVNPCEFEGVDYYIISLDLGHNIERVGAIRTEELEHALRQALDETRLPANAAEDLLARDPGDNSNDDASPGDYLLEP